MNTLIVLLQTTPSGGFASFLPIILIIFVFYFFMIRPQINKQKNEDSFRSQLKKGDKVVTIGGIHGKISVLKETKVILEIANDNLSSRYGYLPSTPLAIDIRSP